MKLKYTILYVENVIETIEFYEKAFSLKRKMIHESNEYGELDTGNTILAFSSKSLLKTLGKEPGDPQIKKPIFEIAFETDNVAQSLKQALEAGAKEVEPIKKMEWGQDISYVSDINDFLIEICSPVYGNS